MAEHSLSAHIGNRVSLTGHFDAPVVLEDVRPLGVNGSALARTVFQRRLASSTHAIHQSLRRRHQKLDELLRELDGLPHAQRARRLAQLQGRLSERVGHLKIGFDIRSLALPDSQTGYRDPVTGVRRIEVKGRRRGRPVRLTTNEWYKAQQLGDTYWLYVVWDPLENPDAAPVLVQNPARHLDYAKREVVAARYYDVPASAVEKATHGQLEQASV